jgi:Amt family ammonium transporter
MNPVSSGADPTTPLEVFGNVTSATGGDSRVDNLNVFYNVSSRCVVSCGHVE